MSLLVTTHKYLDKYPVSADSEKLIVGTIHPHNYHSFEIPFFYGNKATLWKILSAAFPSELPMPLTLDNILNFLDKRKVSVSDTIRECKRQNETALDNDLVPIKLNEKLMADIQNSRIKQILFTSGFQKNNAFKLFYVDLLGLKITKEIKDNREVILDKSRFGREIKLTILYSPSGSSNVGISKSKLYLRNKEKYGCFKNPVYNFKVDYYKENFNN
jgi:G:T/U-mismatch repair DNA glycosylase